MGTLESANGVRDRTLTSDTNVLSQLRKGEKQNVLEDERNTDDCTDLDRTGNHLRPHSSKKRELAMH